jgi:hypothetical protein
MRGRAEGTPTVFRLNFAQNPQGNPPKKNPNWARKRALSGKGFLQQNQWAAVSAAHEMASKKSRSQVLVYLYNQARTYFIKNS